MEWVHYNSNNLVLGNTTYNTKSADGFYFLDLSLDGTYQDTNIVDASGNGYCDNPTIEHVVHTSNNSTYVLMNMDGRYSYSGSNSYQWRCVWNPSSSTSGTAISTFAGTPDDLIGG